MTTENAAQTATLDILICTHRRPDLIQNALKSLDGQDIPLGFRVAVIVADNDALPSSQTAVHATAEQMALPVTYLHAPQHNISVARNACLAASDADWVAMIDDDEVADPTWLSLLLQSAKTDAADIVFGPALAIYPNDAPRWARDQDHHSNIPESRNGQVETGHTCNALMKWRGMPWATQRFDVDRGQSGGEDTEFFFRLGQMGAKMAISETAVVREPVDPKRLNFGWVRQRKFRMGQSYAASATAPLARARLFGMASIKCAYCAISVPFAALRDQDGWRFWWLRAVLHAGVVAGCIHLKQAKIYGDPA